MQDAQHIRDANFGEVCKKINFVTITIFAKRGKKRKNATKQPLNDRLFTKIGNNNGKRQQSKKKHTGVCE